MCKHENLLRIEGGSSQIDGSVYLELCQCEDCKEEIMSVTYVAVGGGGFEKRFVSEELYLETVKKLEELTKTASEWHEMKG